MNTVDDFRRSLERHTALAPDPTGIIEQARTGAARIRRRRRITTTAVAAAAAAVLAVGVPVVSRLESEPAGPVMVRAPHEMTVDVAAGSGFTVETRAVDNTHQYLSIRQQGVSTVHPAAMVWVHDPGTFDAEELPKGKKVRVGGHDAWQLPFLHAHAFAPQFLPPSGGVRPGGVPSSPTSEAASSGPMFPLPNGSSNGQLPPGDPADRNPAAALVWRDRSGSWVTVDGANDVPSLFRLAAAVRLGAPRAQAGPVGLSSLPAGLAVTFAETETNDPWTKARMSLTGPRTWTPAPTSSTLNASVPSWIPKVFVRSATESQGLAAPFGSAIEIYATQLRGDEPPARGTLGTIAGQRVWTFVGSVARVHTIRTATCEIKVSIEDRAQIAAADVERLIAGATFRSCADPAQWRPVVS
jgi:hypothetical protein